MKSKIKVVFQNNQKTVKIPTGIRLLLRRACTAVAELEKLDGNFEVSVSFVDNSQIRELNKKFRNIDKETDVLSFPLGEAGVYDVDMTTGNKLLGDIVLSVERAFSQAEEFGHSLNREMAYLTTHSMLHLLGYDHEQGGIELVKMREKEEKVMHEIGLPRGTSYTVTEEMK